MSEMEASSASADSRTSSLAVWSLILGILGIVPLGILAGIPALICGHMAIPRIRRSAGQLTGRGLAIAGVSIAYVGIVLQVVVLSVMFVGAMNAAKRTSCLMNLRQMGRLAQEYAMDNNEQFPPNLHSLGELANSQPFLFVSPATGHKVGLMAEVDQWSDYVLVPNRKTDDSPDAVLAFTKPECYPGKGGNVLFCGGHVTMCSLDDYNRLISGLTH